MARIDTTLLLYPLLALLPVSSFAVPEVTTTNITYQISGKTADEIWADIRQKSPARHKGRLHVAYTKWEVNWRFWWLEKADSCEITRVTTKLDVAFTMPELIRDTSMPAALISQWEDYYTALFSHEQGHKDLGMQAAREIENAIAGMEPRATCGQLEREANQIGKRVIRKYSRIEKDYDRSTNHGLNTGAVFP